MPPIFEGDSTLLSRVPTSLLSSGARAFNLHVLDVAAWIAPVKRVDRAVGLTSAFVFLQAVHYAVWLSVVPQGELPGQGTVGFRRTGNGVLADFGPVGAALVALAFLVVLLGACENPVRSSASYMSLALFHGYLELVVVLYFWVSGQAPGREDRGARTA